MYIVRLPQAAYTVQNTVTTTKSKSVYIFRFWLFGLLRLYWAWPQIVRSTCLLLNTCDSNTSSILLGLHTVAYIKIVLNCSSFWVPTEILCPLDCEMLKLKFCTVWSLRSAPVYSTLIVFSWGVVRTVLHIRYHYSVIPTCTFKQRSTLTGCVA